MNCANNCNPCKCGAIEGESRKQAAFALLAATREVVIRRAQRALLTVLLETGSGTADDVRALVELPPGVNAKCFGAAPVLLLGQELSVRRASSKRIGLRHTPAR